MLKAGNSAQKIVMGMYDYSITETRCWKLHFLLLKMFPPWTEIESRDIFLLPFFFFFFFPFVVRALKKTTIDLFPDLWDAQLEGVVSSQKVTLGEDFQPDSSGLTSLSDPGLERQGSSPFFCISSPVSPSEPEQQGAQHPKGMAYPRSLQ